MNKILSIILTLGLLNVAPSLASQALVDEALKAKSGQPVPQVYGLDIQKGYSCHLHMHSNHARLLHIYKRECGKLNFQPEDFKSIFASLASTFDGQVAWQLAMTKLYNANGPFREYLDRLSQEGITSSKIFNADGSVYAQSTYNPIEKLRRSFLTPYHFIDLKSVDQEGVWQILPLVYKNGQHHFYNKETGVCEPIVAAADDACVFVWNKKDGKIEGEAAILKLSKQELKKLGLAEYSAIIMDHKPRFGSDAVYYAQYLPNESNDRQFYMTGMFQLSLFAHGIDRDNKEILAGHPLFDAYQEFTRAMGENAENPWRSLDKRNLLEYRLAHLFETNDELKQQVLKVIDAFKPGWTYYTSLKDLKDERGAPLRLDLLPDENQLLAFYFSMQVRDLWTACVSQEALNAVHCVRGVMKKYLGPRGTSWVEYLQSSLSFMPFSSKHYIQKGIEGGDGSFLSTWERVLGQLKASGDFSNYLISFCGHGAVHTFNADDIKSFTFENQQVASRLGFGVFDSEWPDHLKPPFMKMGTEKDKLAF
ncbi:MAG: hypothetical protein KBB83_08635 [Alphaproteobacteria bacterium]|nr:hypothetical protein [Alphaproteobacteria bacterium]